MTTVTLNPSADASIASDTPTTNFGTDAGLRSGEVNNASANRRSCIKFDLSSIPATAVVNAATLRLYLNLDRSDNSRAVRVYRLLRDWVGNQVTWNIYKTGSNWGAAGGFGSADCEQTDIGSLTLTASEANGYKEWTLTPSAVQDWISGVMTNNGLLLKTDTEVNDGYNYNSNEAASNKPELVINYTIGSRQFQAVIIG